MKFNFQFFILLEMLHRFFSYFISYSDFVWAKKNASAFFSGHDMNHLKERPKSHSIDSGGI
jgi:hypothetical protein